MVPKVDLQLNAEGMLWPVRVNRNLPISFIVGEFKSLIFEDHFPIELFDEYG